MQSKGVDITIDTEGNVEKIEAFGFVGKGCLEATEPIENILGRVVNRVHKTEMHKREPLQQERHKQRN